MALIGAPPPSAPPFDRQHDRYNQGSDEQQRELRASGGADGYRNRQEHQRHGHVVHGQAGEVADEITKPGVHPRPPGLARASRDHGATERHFQRGGRGPGDEQQPPQESEGGVATHGGNNTSAEHRVRTPRRHQCHGKTPNDHSDDRRGHRRQQGGTDTERRPPEV